MAIRTCKVCQRKFRAQTGTSFCSETCRIAWYASRQPVKILPFKKCPTCSNTFKPSRAWQKYCSTSCSIKANKEKLLNAIHIDPWYRLRFSILSRDGFRCRYCGRSITEDSVKLEVDHIVPKSKGGTEDQENLITSCRDCNIGKTDLTLVSATGQIPTSETIDILSCSPSPYPIFKLE